MQLINSCNNLLHCFLFHKNMDDGTGIYCKFRDNEFLFYVEKSMWLLARLSEPQPGLCEQLLLYQPYIQGKKDSQEEAFLRDQ